MTLPLSLAGLVAELDMLSQHLRDFAASKPLLNSSAHFTLPDECLLEGLLSRVWQAWCNFCRGCIVKSCIGTVNSAGNPIASLPDALSEAHVSSAAVKARNKKNNPPYWGATNAVLRVEPTWGDVDALVTVVGRLRPTNHAQLLAAFSSGYGAAKALQLIRNCAAHNNTQTLADLHVLHSDYVVFPIGHPTHALFWAEPNTSDFLVLHAMDELKSASQAAIA